MWPGDGRAIHRHVDLPADQVRHHRAGAPIGHMRRGQPRGREEDLHRHMDRTARTGGAEIRPPRIGAEPSDKLRQRRGGDLAWVHHQHVGRDRAVRDEGEVARRVERQPVGVEPGIHPERRQAHDADGVPIRRRASERADADIGCTPRSVLYHHRAANARAQRLRHQPRDHVARPARREGHDQRDVALRPSGLRAGGQRQQRSGGRAEQRAATGAKQVGHVVSPFSVPRAMAPMASSLASDR